MSDRETRILDAAIQVLGTRGTRHLTHRAVDEQAELPTGSTSNRFRTRESLLSGVLKRILEREIETWTTLTAGTPPTDPDTFADAVGRLVRHLAGDARALTAARQAVFIEAAHQPDLQRQIVQSRARLITWAVPLVAALGSPTPAVHLHQLLCLLDGLMANQLATPDPAFDPAAAITTLLRGMLSG